MATELLIDHATGFRVEEVNIGGASPRRELRLTVETSSGPTLITIEAPSIFESADRESLLDKLASAIESIQGAVA